MNDLERDLRELLDEDARRVSTPVAAPEGLRRSARRRQVLFAGAVGLATVAIVAGVVAGASLLLPLQNDGEPAVEGPKTSGTLNGITITYPQSWHLIDPDTAGLNGSPTMGESPLPRIVLAQAPTEKPETFGCPGRANPDEAAPLLMTVQEDPAGLSGPAYPDWPVELQTMSVDASSSACYPNWEFMRAGWRDAGRTFEARVGFGPDASGEERNALLAAFASMTFEPTDSEGQAYAELVAGTAGGESWQLTASRAKGGISIELTAGSTGSGIGSLDEASTDIQATDTVLGTGSQAERVIFGVVPEGIARVEATTENGSPVSADVIDMP